MAKAPGSTLQEPALLTPWIQARAEFSRGLVMEALDEAAFLYTQARRLRTGANEQAAEAFEARLEAQLGVLEDRDAFPPLETLDTSDPGVLYAVVRALCQQNRQEELLSLVHTN